MELLTQKPGEHRCLTYAAAMILNVSPEWIEETLSIDSMEIWWPKLRIPYCYRGIHIQEIQNLVMFMGKGLCLVEVRSYLGADEEHCQPIHQGSQQIINRISNRLQGNKAIIIEHSHAVAWADGKIYDPNGFIKEIDGKYILEKIREIWVLAHL